MIALCYSSMFSSVSSSINHREGVLNPMFWNGCFKILEHTIQTKEFVEGPVKHC